MLAGLCWLSLAKVTAEESNTAAVLHYARQHQQQDAVLAAHRPWVWEINGAHARVWIVGCLHLGMPQDAVVYPAYLPYYQSAATIYFETVPGSWETYDTRRLLGRRGYLEDRRSLSTVLSKATWRDLNGYLASHPNDRAAITTMEPWLAAFTLVQKGYAQSGLRTEDSLETFIQRAAIEDRKPVGGIESPREQLLAMADAPLADQEEFLRDTLNGLKNLDSTIQSLREAWLSGDQRRLQNVLGLDATAMRSGMHESLIGARNKHWVTKLRDLAEARKDSLVLVGVEHLVATPYALPDVLEQAGLSIHRVDPRAKETPRRSASR